MATINQLQYSKQYEKLRAQGLSHDEAHWRAVQFATTKPKPTKAKKKKEGRIRRLARLTKMAALGKHYKAKWESPRTKAITEGLKVAELTKEEIARFRK